MLSPFFNKLAKSASLCLVVISSFAFAQPPAAQECHDGYCPAVPATPLVSSVDKSANDLKTASLPTAAWQSQKSQSVTGQLTWESSFSEFVEQLPKRRMIFMTAVDDNGHPFSKSNGAIKFPFSLVSMAALLMAALTMLYFILDPSPEINASKVEKLSAKDSDLSNSSPPPTLSTQIDVQPNYSVEPDDSPVSWADLVKACNGDAIRAATILSAEVAIDTKLTADSPVAIARAFTRLKAA